MLRSLTIAACLCAVACGNAPPPEPTVTCPTADEFVHGRKLSARTLAAYAIAAHRCAEDKWDQKAIRCIRASKDFDGEDHCYAILLSPSQRDGLANALAVLDTPPPDITAKGVPGLALVEKAGTYTLHSDWLDVTLPTKPWVEHTTDDYAGAKLPTTVASAADGVSQFTVIVQSIPAGLAYDPDAAIKTSRDDSLKGAFATLVSDESGEVGGLRGRRVLGKGGPAETPLFVEVRLVYDEAHRAQIVMTAMTRGAALDPRAAEMFDSLVLGAAGK